MFGTLSEAFRNLERDQEIQLRLDTFKCVVCTKCIRISPNKQFLFDYVMYLLEIPTRVINIIW